LAIWLGGQQGIRDASLLDSPWTRILDRGAAELLPLALQAHRSGFVRARTSGDLVEIDPSPLDRVRA